MIKQSITYPDLDENMVTDEFYFHLSKAELIEMDLIAGRGGLQGAIEEIIKEQDTAKVIDLFKKIILGSIGERSDDNKRFIKNQEIRDRFSQSAAYSELFISMVKDADMAAKFITGLAPQGLKEDLDAIAANQATETAELPATDISATKPEEPAWIREDREPTRAELDKMTQPELVEAFRRRNQRSQ